MVESKEAEKRMEGIIEDLSVSTPAPPPPPPQPDSSPSLK